MEAKGRKESKKIEMMEKRRKTERSKTDAEVAKMRTVILGSGLNDGEIKLESKTKNNLYDKDKVLYTQCENDLKSLTRIMKTKFIGYHKREKKFYVSAS